MTIRAIGGAALHASRMLRQGSSLRHTAEWVRSLRRDYLVSRPSPWMTFGAVDFLRETLKSGITVFEYGSGGSTLFWLQWARSVVSIEHDREWYDRLRPLLEGRPVDYRLVEPESRGSDTRAADPAVPSEYATEDAGLRHMRFVTYARQIDGFEDGSFDLVCVDGRSRPACVVHSAPKVKPGGMLVLDNSDRAYYLTHTREALSGFQKLDFAGPVPCLKFDSMTSIFVRGR